MEKTLPRTLKVALVTRW